MDNIFLSRPNWVAPEFEQGLEAFTNILTSYDINPRTLGISDSPTNTPLDEVISIMDQCVGAIILGYPQIEIKNGFLKGKQIDLTVTLATEWNHIEAGLAYAKGLPLLVIHHTGVQGGIFDRGAISKFLYEIDLSRSTWFSEKPILGAINAWRQKLNSTTPSNSPERPKQDDLKFHPRFGIMVSEKSNTYYCTRCYHSSPSKPVGLQVHKAGWTCHACDKFYSNPDYDPPDHCITDFDPFQSL
jgi:hypothetical protein